MRKFFSLLAVAAMVAGTAGAAFAAPGDFTASLTVQVGTLPPVTASGSGSGTSAGAGGTATIPANTFSVFASAPISPPLLSLLFGFVVGAPGQTGMVAPFAPGSSNALAFNGSTGTMGLNASAYLLNKAGKAVAGIPLGIIGVGGTTTFSVLGLVTGTIFANPYQLGMVTISGQLPPDPAVVLMGTGVDARTANGGGTLTLVSPTNVSLGPLGNLPALATLVINYELNPTPVIPEPGTVLLLGAGIAGLAAIGRKRLSA
jgi:hypothetical protein